MTDSIITHHTALVYLMVLVSASDRNMTDIELKKMGDIVQTVPAFEGYDPEKLVVDAENVAEILDAEEGFEATMGLIIEALPETHLDTAYALACEVAIADTHLSQEELRILELIRHQFNVDRLTAAAIERGSAARNRGF